MMNLNGNFNGLSAGIKTIEGRDPQQQAALEQISATVALGQQAMISRFNEQMYKKEFCLIEKLTSDYKQTQTAKVFAVNLLKHIY